MQQNIHNIMLETSIRPGCMLNNTADDWANELIIQLATIRNNKNIKRRCVYDAGHTRERKVNIVQEIKTSLALTQHTKISGMDVEVVLGRNDVNVRTATPRI